jgi:hypothetical protein
MTQTAKRRLGLFLAGFLVYWLLAPFALFWSSRTWHIVESVAFGAVVAAIPWHRFRRRSATLS